MRMLKQMLVPGLVLYITGLITGCTGLISVPSAAVVPSPDPAQSPTPSPTPTPSGTPTPTPSPTTTTVSNIQTLAGWQNCTGTCTNTALAVFSMTQAVTSPSESGSSTRFQLLAGTQPFGAALWFKFVTTDNNATHFIYDLLFFTDNPSAAQALEFNVSQSAGGNRYNFSTQCDLAGHAWRVWEPVAQAWLASSVECATPQANTWNHLVWEFERDSAGNTLFTAVTFNGSRNAVNISVPHTADSSNGIDVAFQADANITAALYSVWLDEVSLTYW